MADPKPRWRKPWSVRDADHIPNGGRVIVSRAVVESYRAMAARLDAAFGIGVANPRMTGTITRRFGSEPAWYAVTLDDMPRTTVGVGRSDMICPIPDNVIALDPARRKAVTRG